MSEDISIYIERSISRIRDDHCSDDRLSRREEIEDSAKGLIEENLGDLDEDQIGDFLTKINTDYYGGEEKQNRFGQAFGGSNKKKIKSNDIEELNLMFEDLYDRGDTGSAEKWQDRLDGVRDGMISSLLYLHDRDKYNVMLKSMKRGLKEIYEDFEFSSKFKEEEYEEYNQKINDLKDEFGFQPQEIDIIFSVLYDKDIFFAPGDDFEKSVLNPVKISELDQEEITEDIPEHIPSEFYLWGVKPTDKPKGFWDEIEYGDLVLFYKNGQDDPRCFGYCAGVLDKMEHEGLAEEVFGKDDDDSISSLLIILDDPLKIDLPISEFLNKVEYDEGFYPRGFSRIDPGKIDISNSKRKKKDMLIDWIESGEYPKSNGVKGVHQSEAGEELKAATQMLEDKKQLVLYGPPGTSKTFFAKRLAIWLAEKEAIYEEKEVNEKFEELKKDGETALVQFHPSYSYEDFIEGYRPQEDGNYDLDEGIFKEMCDELNKKKLEDYSAGYLAVVDTYTRTTDPIEIPQHVKGSLNERNSINKIDRFDFEAVLENSDLRSLLEGEEELSSYYILKMKEDSRYQDREEEQYHFPEGIAGSRQLSEDLDEGKVGFLYHDTERGGVFGGGIFSEIEETSVEETDEKRVLIIDEINRAEIAKVLGELIYGLEYRGESIDLQYSDEPLKVPENLYIIATMNTADRSIALVDAAIRRRFSFIQKMPDYDLLSDHLELNDDDGFDEETLRKSYGEDEERDLKILSVLALNHINDEILEEERLGREKQVGHTYLMRLEGDDVESKFLMAWKNDILPLLEEYYYFNYDQLQEIFSDSDRLMDEKQGIKNFDADDLKKILEKLCEI